MIYGVALSKLLIPPKDDCIDPADHSSVTDLRLVKVCVINSKWWREYDKILPNEDDDENSIHPPFLSYIVLTVNKFCKKD